MRLGALMATATLALLLGGCAEGPVAEGQLEGTAMLGPTCPGPERDPAEPGCGDKPYVGSLEVRESPGTKVVLRFETASDGSFRVTVPVGTYLVGTSAERSTPPTCGSLGVTVVADATATVTVQCDTGIR